MIACPPTSPRILVIANPDAPPPPESGLGALLGRAEFRFLISSMDDAPEKIAEHEPAAAIIMTPTEYFTGIRQNKLTRVLDDLAEKQIGAILLTRDQADLSLATRLCENDGLMALPMDFNPPAASPALPRHTRSSTSSAAKTSCSASSTPA
jgi:hypothetical protein